MTLTDRQAEVDLENVQKTFAGGSVGVEQLDLHVTSGECVALVGESGSGKTTTLRLVAGLERATRGSIRFAGLDVSHWAPHRRRVAMVGQRPVLHPRWTVAQHLECAWALRNGPALGSWRWWRQLWRGVAGDGAYRQQRDEVVQAWDVERLLPRRAAELSSGEQQQVALARAMMTDPQVYLLDEPFSAVDVSRRWRLRWQLKAWQRRFRRTMLYVTHDHGEALAMGDRVAVLHRGRIAQVGSPSDVYRRPARLAVAKALGEGAMNFVAARVISNERGLRCETPYFQAQLANSQALFGERSAGLPSSVTLGIRPEQLQLAAALDGSTHGQSVHDKSAQGGDEFSARGRITNVSRQGDFDWVQVALETRAEHHSASSDLARDVWLVRAAAWSSWREDEQVEVRGQASDLLGFDSASGDNLTA